MIGNLKVKFSLKTKRSIESLEFPSEDGASDNVVFKYRVSPVEKKKENHALFELIVVIE